MKLILLLICFIVLRPNGGDVVADEIKNGMLGGSVYFYESLPIQANPIIIWTFKDAIIAQYFLGGNPVCHGQYFRRCGLSENGTLRLDRLTYADEGNYMMIAQYPNTTIIASPIYVLKIYSALNVPSLNSREFPHRLISGTDGILLCVAAAQTVTTYTFHRDGKNICSEPHVICRDSHLYFQPIRESDSGSYTCTIQNPVSSNTSHTLQLRVSVPVSGVKLTSNVSGLVWPGLDSVSLTCSTRGTDVSYSWSLQGAPLPQDPQYHLTENNRVLIISPFSAKDNGTFTCTATNWINNSISSGVMFSLASEISKVTLISNTSGSYIWVGEGSASFHCWADGSAAAFVWKLNGEPLSPNSRYHLSQGESPQHSDLFISPVSRNDSRTFSCDASNRLGSKTSNALNLNLFWNPEVPMKCSAIPTGQNVELGCSWSGGHPETNVSLIFNGIKDDGQSAVTRMVSTGDNLEGKELTCLGDQLGRTSQCTLKLVPPEALGHNNDTITNANVGEALILTVILVPGLPAEFTWYRLNPDRILIKTNRKVLLNATSSISSLQIRDVTLEDAGKYECRAKNIIGSRSFLFTVHVTEYGLSGGVLAGIVIGVLFGVVLIGMIAGFCIRRKKKPSMELVYENADVVLPNIYESGLSSISAQMEKKAATPESLYEQLAFQDKVIYSTLNPGQKELSIQNI